MSVEETSDNVWFVLFAYVAAFMPWTFLSSKDFIGPQWKTVKATRTAGIYHAIFTVIPACYIIAYMVVQGLSDDNKEMSAALVALVFSLLNLLRTLWGLWQLWCFREWAISSIKALEAMGVPYTLHRTRNNESHDESDDEKNKENSGSREDLDDSEHKEASEKVETLADRLLVNETIVDNQLAHGEARCFLKYGDIDLKDIAENEVSVVRYLRNLWQELRVVAYFLVDYGRSIVFNRKRGAKFEMVPFKPVNVWLNWSVAFAAQGLGQWIKDFSVPRDPRDSVEYDDISAEERWEKRAQFFGLQLVSSAWLQLWSETGVRAGRSSTSPLHWCEVWNKVTGMNDGVAMKKELLEEAMKSGRGLPFEASHDAADGNSGERPGYHAYRRIFDQIVNDVPVRKEFDEMIEKFDIEKLEWLTILLYIGTIAAEKEKGRVESREEHGTACTTESTEVIVDNNEEEMGSSQALINLRRQVYLPHRSRRSDGRDTELERRSELFNCVSVGVRQNSKLFLSEDNRHVSKVGEMIDAWMSLACGDQIAFLTELNGSKFWEDVCCCANMRSLNGDRAMSLSCDESKSLQAVHAEVEKRRIFYNFVNDANWFDSCEQFMTFMGYRMETVRSRLGSWVLRNEGRCGSDEEFCPLIRDVDGVSVELGEEVSEVLLEDLEMRNWSRRGVQTRFLWEVQQELAKRAEPERVGPGSAELVLLCILSFPSIRIEEEKEENGKRDIVTCETKKSCVCVNVCWWRDDEASSDCVKDGKGELPRMKIYAVGGPQGIDVVGTFSQQGRILNVQLELRGSEESERFKWVLWRDAFLGRLKGVQEWQEKHGIRSAELQMTDDKMRADVKIMNTYGGEKVVCWPGWKPFRYEFMLFELESEGLLKEQVVAEEERAKHMIKASSTLTSQEQKDRGEGQLLAWQGKLTLYLWLGSIPRMQVKSVAYTEASAAVLRHAVFVVEEAFDIAGTDGRAEVETDRSEALLKTAKECAGNDWERAVSILETPATVNGDEKALDECVNVLMKHSNERNSGLRVVSLLEKFLAQAYSSGRRSSQKHLLSNCSKVMKWFGDQNGITGRLSRLFAHIWTISESSLREETLAELQTMYGMCRGTTVLETLSLLLYHDFSSGNMDAVKKLQRNVEVFSESELQGAVTATSETATSSAVASRAVTSTSVARDLVRDSLKTCERFNGNVAVKLEGRGSERDLASVRCWTLKALGSESTEKDYKETVELYRKVIGNGNAVSAIAVVTSWAAVLIEGQGCHAQNEEKITEMCTFATEHGDVTTTLLAIALECRNDKAIYTRKAEELYRRAIQDGNVLAMHKLAHLLEKGREGVERNAKEAEKLYRRAIQSGLDGAMNNLAFLLVHGAEGVERNVKEAEDLYRRAIQDGNDTDAMYNLAGLLVNGAEGVERNAKEAEKLYRRAIEDGNHNSAMNNLGSLLENGAEGVERNAKEAEELYRRAIQDGNNTDAMYNLASLMENGAEGVERNAKEAEELYRRAIEDGNHTSAMNNLAVLLKEHNAKEAEELYRRAIQDGNDTDAMYNLAGLLVNGAEGVERNAKEAEKLYRRAIEDGNHNSAMNNLGSLLENGAEGVEQNAKEAEELYRRAIQDGNNTSAMNNLGRLLVNGGPSVERNAKEAEDLYRRAIEDGNHTSAMNNLGSLLENGAKDVERNAKEAEDLYRRAIQDGNNTDAMYNLASLMENGAEGVERNAKEAEELYRRAIQDGKHIGAMNNLAVLLKEHNAKEAEELYRRAIQDGNDTDAMYNLASLLANGAEGVERNAKEAEKLYRRAIEDGNHNSAMNNLGSLLENGAEGVERNAKEAEELYRRAIQDGNHISAMNNLGRLLVNGGPGVERNAKEAEDLYRRAIEDGNHTSAMNNLASLLENGAKDVERNAKEAEDLYRHAIQDGNDTTAMNNLALLLKNGAKGVERNAKEAEELFRRAIKAGNDTASMNNLALLLVNGGEGVERDTKEAEELFRCAIEGGNVRAMYNLASLLVNGAEGVERNAKEAEELYRRAIEAGNDTAAMNNLAFLLVNGAEGVERDAKEAEELFRRAIEAGNDTSAMNNLAFLLASGVKGMDPNAKEAVELYRRAIEGGHISAMNKLALLLENGAEGVERNAKEAEGLYRRAIEDGNHTDAMRNLAALLANGAEGVARNETEAEELYRRAIDVEDGNI